MRFCGLKLQNGSRFVSARKLSLDVISSRHNVPLGRSLFPIKKGLTTRSSLTYDFEVSAQCSHDASHGKLQDFMSTSFPEAFFSTIFKMAARRESFPYLSSWKWRRLWGRNSWWNNLFHGWLCFCITIKSSMYARQFRVVVVLVQNWLASTLGYIVMQITSINREKGHKRPILQKGLKKLLPPHPQLCLRAQVVNGGKNGGLIMRYART